jgi:hypothetical protein
MAQQISNVYIATDTFASWVDKTNQGLDLLSTFAVTTTNTAAGALTTGNGSVNGIFSANTIVAGAQLRGGNVTTSNTLFVISTVDVQNTFSNAVTIAANLTISAAAGRTANVNTPTEFRANVHVVSGAANVWINSTKASVVTTNTDLYGTELAVFNNTAGGSRVLSIVSGSNNVTFNTNNYTINTTNTLQANVGNVAINASNTTIGNSTVFGVRVTNDTTTTSVTIAGNASTIASNLTVSAANADIRNVTFNAANTIFGGSGNVAITSTTANISSNVVASGANITFTSASTVNLLGNVFFTSDVQNIVVSNTDIGANVTAAQTVYQFAMSSYSAAEVTAVAKKGSNTQISRFLVSHDGGINVQSTMYGTITAPTSANLGILQTAINGSNVAIRYLQNTTNSSVKLILNLVK